MLLDMLPAVYDIEMVNAKYPVDYNESMNTVLVQELIRFNKLLSRILKSLADTGKAVKGLVVMTSELEEVSNGIFNNQRPGYWMQVSYPSLKPLSSYVSDLAKRLSFLQEWIDKGAPASFWLSGLFFTQSFITGQLQNYARKERLPIDSLHWNYLILKRNFETQQKPPEGCYTYGTFLDGARWDDGAGVVDEAIPKMLFDAMPMIHLVPVDQTRDKTSKNIYPSPLYKTSERRGTLSTTGHSTNFVMTVLLPISADRSEKYWTKRGVAMLCQLDE